LPARGARQRGGIPGGPTPLDPLCFVLAVPAVVLAGSSNGGIGSGASFVAVPILAEAVEPAVAVAVLLPHLLVIDVAALGANRKRRDRAESLVLDAGAVPGVVLAAAFWRIADADAVRLFIRCIALALVRWHLSVRLRPAAAAPRASPQRGAGRALGAAAGFSSFVSNAGGPPVAAYLLARGLGKTGYQATTVLVAPITSDMKAIPFTGPGGLYGRKDDHGLDAGPGGARRLMAGGERPPRSVPAVLPRDHRLGSRDRGGPADLAGNRLNAADAQASSPGSSARMAKASPLATMHAIPPGSVTTMVHVPVSGEAKSSTTRPPEPSPMACGRSPKSWPS